MRILITGGSGFVAPHLIEYIQSLNQKHKISIIVRQRGDNSQLDRLTYLDQIKVYKGDLLNYATVYRVLNEVQPEVIFHLAAQSFVQYSFEDPVGSVLNNMQAQMNLLEVVREQKINPVIHIAGSSEEYGKVKNVPIKETDPLRPLSPYGVSKVIQEMMACQYYESYGMKNVVTRAFNHEGPGRGKQFFLSDMCYQVARIEAGWQPPTIEVGDLTSTRDITHVKDMVRAYWLAVEKCDYGEPYNISSDFEIRMRSLLEMVLERTKIKVKIIKQENRLRPSDVTQLLGDSTKFRNKTGWKPDHTLVEIVGDTLTYWRGRLQHART